MKLYLARLIDRSRPAGRPAMAGGINGASRDDPFEAETPVLPPPPPVAASPQSESPTLALADPGVETTAAVKAAPPSQPSAATTLQPAETPPREPALTDSAEFASERPVTAAGIDPVTPPRPMPTVLKVRRRAFENRDIAQPVELSANATPAPRNLAQAKPASPPPSISPLPSHTGPDERALQGAADTFMAGLGVKLGPAVRAREATAIPAGPPIAQAPLPPRADPLRLRPTVQPGLPPRPAPEPAVTIGRLTVEVVPAAPAPPLPAPPRVARGIRPRQQTHSSRCYSAQFGLGQL